MILAASLQKYYLTSEGLGCQNVWFWQLQFFKVIFHDIEPFMIRVFALMDKMSEK